MSDEELFGGRPDINYLAAIAKEYGELDTSGLCPLIVLQSDGPEKQKKINELLRSMK